MFISYKNECKVESACNELKKRNHPIHVSVSLLSKNDQLDDNGDVPKPYGVVGGSIPDRKIVSLLDRKLAKWSSASWVPTKIKISVSLLLTLHNFKGYRPNNTYSSKTSVRRALGHNWSTSQVFSSSIGYPLISPGFPSLITI